MSASVLVSGDEMEAILDLPAGEKVDVEELRILLAGVKVQHGLQREVLFQATRPETEDRQLVVARGSPAVLGESGRVELLIDLHELPPADATGKRDVHHQKRICDVIANQPLARLLPPTLGHPGHTVLGNELAASPGLPGEYGPLKGDGVGTDAAGCLVANYTGVCRLSIRAGQRVLTVAPGLYIDGDVDRTIGNIVTTHDIEIRGDIKAGFSVKTSGNLTIHGVIEDSRVSAQGHIVSGGILKGVSRVKAQGDITARHIEGREVKCRNLVVSNSIVGGKIMALGHVTARDIIGGSIVCSGTIICDHLGDPWATPTSLHVGVNPYEETLFAVASKERARAMFQIHDLEDRCRIEAIHLRGALTGGKGKAAAAAIEARLRGYLEEREKVRALVERCDKVIAEHAEYITKSAALVAMAKVEAKRELNPGVTVAFGPYPVFSVNEALKSTVLYCKDGRVGA
jgi:uncharacterized protein (DUF342 family)